MQRILLMFKDKSVFILPCLLLAVLLLTSCSNSPQAAQSKIDKIAQNTQAELPKMLDRDTSLVNVYTRKLELVSEYELVNYESSESGNKKVRSKIEAYLNIQVCPGIKKELLSRGISSRYIYRDNDSRVIGEWLIVPGDC